MSKHEIFSASSPDPKRDGTFAGTEIVELQARVAAVNALIGCNLIVRPVTADEVPAPFRTEQPRLVIVEGP